MPSCAPVRLERLRLATASVEGEHQLHAQALAVRVRRDKRLELGDQRVLAPEREVRLDPGLDCGQSQLLGDDLALCEGREGEVGKRSSPPECQGIPKRQRSPIRLTASQLAPTPLQQRLEALGVEVFWQNTQHVACCLREQELVAGSVHQDSAQPREIDAQDRVDRLWAASPRSSSISRSRAMGSFACTRRRPRSARCFGPPSRSACWPRSTSSGRGCETPRCDCPFVGQWYAFVLRIGAVSRPVCPMYLPRLTAV